MKKALIIILLTFSIGTYSASAQSLGRDYQTAAGVKFFPGAITVKHFIKSNAALEGLGYFWNYGFRLTGLYEFHGNINGAPGLKWYVGPGAHIGFWSNRWKDQYPTYDGGAYFGIDGVLGLDYKINNIPINVSLDWQPSFNFGNGPDSYYGFYSGFGGLAVRYTF